ncbi:related to vacuolar sorting protein VPS1, dynamin, and related proteins [Rhynchosporium agropyri]|uniref:Related to vacuolar sorting protein VPS1, dynamin, and related proteins n=1 Tax=Rhynchosporium agropyri TaxID=914238 RepID=A0A1E1K3R2_9HELO|nr:related to vacuolar sorting protein VPS1, dynamin, and related proteins [Rhynchosporium agropyri]
MEILDEKVFGDLMREVPAIMGISDDPLHSKTFSDDVLCLEVCGPEQAHLSVIDIPGIFKRTTQGVTSKADMQMVKSMVQSYMENPRSVILAVIPANVDIATQEILEMAEEVDPEGQRTLGVLTKPDLVDKGAEQAVVDLIEEKDRTGIPALKIRLQEVLATHTRREFPKVKSELNRRLKACRSSFATLGASRDTAADQSRYLIDIAARFQEVASLALDAKYWGDGIFDLHDNLRLATLMVGRSEAFSNMIQKSGHTYQFETMSTVSRVKSATKKGQKLPNTFQFGTVAEQEVPGSPTWQSQVPEEVESGSTSAFCNTRLNKDHEDIGDILSDNEELISPEGPGILQWLTKVYRSSRGFELGTFDPSLLAITMREQSKKWNSIAVGYISDAVTIVHNFITNLLQVVCVETRVRNGLISLLIDGLLERYKKAIAQVEFVLQVERSEKPATQNHYFNDTLEKCRQKRMQQAMSTKAFDDCSHGTVVRLEDIMSHHPMSNIEHTVQDLHDILKSYYQVAWKRAVDVVCMQAAEHHLISGPGTPLKLFSPAFVSIMTSEQLQEIAGEDPSQIRKRKLLQKEMEDLEKGKKILT